MAKVTITKSLQETVLSNEHIDKVHFDAQGRHYFNVFNLPVNTDESKKEKPEMDLFGTGVYSHNQIIPGKTNIDKLTEIISVGDAETRIVNTMTRQEVLDAIPENNDETLASKVVNSTDEEKAVILAALGLTPEVLESLKALSKKPAEQVKINL